MTRRICLALLLTFAVLPLAGFRGCSEAEKTKADRLILAFKAAQSLPAAFGVTGDEAQLVSDAFGALATAAEQLRDGATSWDTFVQTFEEVRGRPSWQRLSPALRDRINAVWAVSRLIIESLKPPPGARSEGRPDLNRVDEAQLRELERLTGRRK